MAVVVMSRGDKKSGSVVVAEIRGACDKAEIVVVAIFIAWRLKLALAFAALACFSFHPGSPSRLLSKNIGPSNDLVGSDRGREFTSQAFTTHLQQAGTVRHLTTHDLPKSNSVAERSNCIHIERAHAMITAGGPKFLWAEAIRHSV
jgi:hypothetical protein